MFIDDNSSSQREKKIPHCHTVVQTYIFQESISKRICSFDHQILLSCISPNLFLCKSGQPSRPHSYDTFSVKSFQISPFSILPFFVILKYYFGTTIRAFISSSFTSHSVFLCLFQVNCKSSDKSISLCFLCFTTVHCKLCTIIIQIRNISPVFIIMECCAVSTKQNKLVYILQQL